jgi:hypothetical protein
LGLSRSFRNPGFSNQLLENHPSVSGFLRGFSIPPQRRGGSQLPPSLSEGVLCLCPRPVYRSRGHGLGALAERATDESKQETGYWAPCGRNLKPLSCSPSWSGRTMIGERWQPLPPGHVK